MTRLLLKFVAIGLALAPRVAAAQATQAPPAGEVRDHERTAPITDARFEIIQSAIAVRLTLRLDRWAGTTWQLVQRADSSLGWQQLIRFAHNEVDAVVGNRPNYQMIISGIDVRFTLLINVNTGATWQLREDPKQGWYWAPIG